MDPWYDERRRKVQEADRELGARIRDRNRSLSIDGVTARREIRARDKEALEKDRRRLARAQQYRKLHPAGSRAELVRYVARSADHKECKRVDAWLRRRKI